MVSIEKCTRCVLILHPGLLQEFIPDPNSRFALRSLDSRMEFICDSSLSHSLHFLHHCLIIVNTLFLIFFIVSLFPGQLMHIVCPLFTVVMFSSINSLCVLHLLILCWYWQIQPLNFLLIQCQRQCSFSYLYRPESSMLSILQYIFPPSKASKGKLKCLKVWY